LAPKTICGTHALGRAGTLGVKNIRLLLLPGLHGTEELFRPFLDSAPPEFDLRVMSFPTDQILSYEALADRVQEHLKDTTPTVLLGESFSGPLALMAAERQPNGVVGVILVASFVLPPAPSWLRFLPWRLIFKISAPLYVLRALLANSKDAGVILRRTSGVMKNISPAVLAARIHSVLTVNATAALRSCGVPILYLIGSHDKIVRPWNLKKIRALRPDVVVGGIEAPHFILQYAPLQAWQSISKFIQGLSPRA
jgi:pimeloyl-ACP methyl ester carboxylesterase